MKNTQIKYRQWMGTEWRYWGFIDGGFVAPIQGIEDSYQLLPFPDKNGNEIWEGGFVRYDLGIREEELTGERYCIGQVVWFEEFQQWQVAEYDPRSDIYDMTDIIHDGKCSWEVFNSRNDAIFNHN